MNHIDNWDNWDPLDAKKNYEPELLTATQKREIKNILKSYVGQYDCFSELIQNAMDSVDKRYKEDSNYHPYLWLTINLQENSFTITDNGVGFNKKELQSFLAPNISFKDKIGSRGNKGVGATYIAYGFNYLEFGTKTPSYAYIGQITGGREWVDDQTGIKTRPMVEQCNEIDEYFQIIDQGASFKIKFNGDNIRPKDLSWYSADTASQWMYLLLIKTPLGCLPFSEKSTSKIQFTIKVINKNGENSILENLDATYIFPEKVIAASINLKEVLQNQTKILENGGDISNIPSRFTQGNGLYEYFSKEDLLKFKLNAAEKELITRYKVSVYAYFVYSTAIWDRFNDDKAQLRKKLRILRGGIQLANNKMTQGELTVIPLTSNIGYQNQCHVVVHFEDADPDLGRKGFQPELKELADQISVNIVNKLKKWNRKLLKTDTGTAPEIEKEKSLHVWIQEQEKYEETNPISLKNPNFFNPVNEISITSEPRSEQDVIVLFNQLIAGGVIRGIKLSSTSQMQQYDGIYKHYIENTPLFIFDKKKNPLGIGDGRYDNSITTKPKVLEYKYNIDGLIREFASEEKRPRDIDLVISWEIGTEYMKDYEITSLLDLDNVHLRPFHGITHILRSNTHIINVIALKELMLYLNDVDGVQEDHKKKYGEDLFI